MGITGRAKLSRALDLDGDVLLDIYRMGYEPVRAMAEYLNGRRDFPAWIKLWTIGLDKSNIGNSLITVGNGSGDSGRDRSISEGDISEP
jgi:hypothetical protein